MTQSTITASVDSLQFLRAGCTTDLRAALLLMEMNEHAAAWDRISIVTSTLNQMVQQILPGDNDINVDGAYQGLSPQDTIKAMLRELADDKLVVMISLGELTRAAIRLETMRLGLCELFVIRRDALRECHMRECRYS